MHGQFARDMEDKDKNNTWRWMRKSDLKGSLRLWYVVPRNSLYGLTIYCTILRKLPSHPFVECVVQEMRLYLIQWVHVANLPKRSKQRHDSVGRYVHWQFCEKLGFNRARLWYEHEPESVAENKNFKILWDFTIQYDHVIEARRPDIVGKKTNWKTNLCIKSTQSKVKKLI